MDVHSGHNASAWPRPVGSDSDGFQRLIQLKEDYFRYKGQLEKIDNSKTIDQAYRPHTPLVFKKFRADAMDVEQLHVVCKQVMEQHGTGCHIDTLTTYVRKRWPAARNRDGAAFDVHDYRNSIHHMLKQKSHVYTGTSSGSYALNRQHRGGVENATTTKPLASAIVNAIKKQNGVSTFQGILDSLLESWTLPIIRGREIDDRTLEEVTRTTLESNPRFQYDHVDHELYVLTPKRKKNKRLYDAIEDLHDLSPPAKKPRVAPTVKVYQVQSRHGDDVEAPPPGYACPCGATAPGRSPVAKWRLDDDLVWKCITCYESAKNAVPESGKRRSEERETRRNRSTSRSKSAAKDVETEEPWIQCDRCQSWVPTSKDNITDLSLYDDNNPNHLDYFCPKCRAKSHQDETRVARNRRRNRH